MRTDIPFRGSAAVTDGHVTRRQLTGPDFRCLARGTFVDVDAPDPLVTAVLAATSRHPGAVVAGATAAALLGAVDPDDEPTVDVGGLDPVELTRAGGGSRAGTGVRIRREHLDPGEVIERDVAGVRLLVTSAARTAYDLGRSLPTVDAVVIVESLVRGHGLTIDAVRRAVDRHPHARNLVRLRAALALVERGARCPIESRIRIALVAAGLAPPVVGHVATDNDGAVRGVADLGWPEERCAMFCDRDPDAAHRLGGRLVMDGWRVWCVEASRWRQEPAAVVENAERVLRAQRRVLGLERRDEVRALRGEPRAPRPKKVRLYR